MANFAQAEGSSKLNDCSVNRQGPRCSRTSAHLSGFQRRRPGTAQPGTIFWMIRALVVLFAMP